MSRVSWDDVWMATAISVARRSLCSRAKIGAVVVTADNRVQAASFNGAPDRIDVEGKPCDHWCQRVISGETGPDYSTCPSIHAEANAIMRSDYSAIQGGTLYVTGPVCTNCAKLVVGSGVSRVVQARAQSASYRDPDGVAAYMSTAGLEVVWWDPDDAA